MEPVYVTSRAGRVKDNDIPHRFSSDPNIVMKWDAAALRGLRAFDDERVCLVLYIDELIDKGNGDRPNGARFRWNASKGYVNGGQYILIENFANDCENMRIKTEFWVKDYGKGKDEKFCAEKWIYFMKGMFGRSYPQAELFLHPTNAGWAKLMEALRMKMGYDQENYSGRGRTEALLDRMSMLCRFAEVYHNAPFSCWAEEYSEGIRCWGFCPEALRSEVDRDKKALLDRVFSFRIPVLGEDGQNHYEVKTFPYGENADFLAWASGEAGVDPSRIKIRMG